MLLKWIMMNAKQMMKLTMMTTNLMTMMMKIMTVIVMNKYKNSRIA